MTDYDNNLPLVIVHPRDVRSEAVKMRLRRDLEGTANVLITRDGAIGEALVIPVDEINHLLNYSLESLKKYIENREYEGDDVLEIDP